MRKLTKILSAILVIVLCVQIIAPGTVAIVATPLIGNNAAMSAAEGMFLDGTEEITPLLSSEQDVDNSSMPEDTREKTTSIIGEAKELRTENTKHYRHKDGTYTAAIYPEPVHYMDSTGSWQDIDNTLTLNSKKKSVSGKATYTPASSSLDIRIPQDFSDNQMLTIGKDGYTVGMRIKDSSNSAAMSRSSSATSSKISSAKAVIDNDFESMEIASELSTSNISASNDFAVESANKEKMKLEKKVSAVNYNDIFDGADLQYVITPSKIKENIIVTEKQNSYVYQFELDLDGLIVVPQDNGSIKLYENLDDNEAVFVIETPYMFDANEETSFDVTMSLNGNILTVTANSEWINDESRTFPITIDPTFSIGSSTFYDATVGYGTPLLNYESYKYLYAGNGVLSLRRAYIKFDLPTIPDGSVVTKAELKLLQYDIDVGNEDLYLYAVDLTGQSTWSEGSITWNNQPLSTAQNGPQDDYTIKKIDYASFIESDGNQEYVFNLTKAVKNWYEGSTNNGIMISSSNETKNSQTTLYSSDHSTSSYHPTVTIEYSNNIGLENYWTYETRDLGRSGTVYANPYNGSITYLHNDLNMTGNLLPINISHVYNSNTDGIYSTYYEGMYVGAKYHLSIQELLLPISTSDSMYSAGYRYKYYDSDGTLHYFKHTKVSSNFYKYLLEYDPTVYVSFTSSCRMIEYADGSKKYFYNDGRIYKIIDNNGNTQTFTYDGKKITQITDTVGRVAILTYNANGQLESITDPSGRKVLYEYANTTATACLTSITYPDGKQTVITYTTNDYLNKLTATDNSYLRFYYKTVSKRGRRVSWIDPYDKNGTRIDEIAFTYTATNESGTASGNTVVSNNYDDSKTFLFDKYGRAISVTNQYGQSQYAIYGNDATNNSDEFNKILSSSDLLTISGNLLKNHGFERNDYWSVLQTASTGSCDYSTEESSNGYRSGKIELTENSGIYEVGQDFDAVAGETYTMSLDIHIPEKLNVSDNNGASFGFVYCLDGVWYTENSRWLTSTSGWERFSHTVTIPEGTLTSCRVFIELARTKGKVYFDNAQVEKSAGARYYNLVENANFSNTPDVTEGVDAVAATAYAWTKAGTQGDDGVYTVNGRNYVYMSGSPDHNKRIAQTIPLNAKTGDTMIIGGRAGAYATDGEYDGRYFRAYAELYTADNLCFDTVTIDFDRSVNQEHQTRASVIKLSQDCDHIIYYFVYFYHLDSVSFDDAFIYLDKYGEHYDYENGLLNSSYNDEGKTTNYTYSNNNVTEITEEVSGVEQTVASYEYDSKHNVTSATNNIGTVIEYDYNNSGQVTKQTTKFTNENNEEITISESFEYYQGGNYIKSHTNENDGITTYEYDNIDIDDENADDKITKGLLTSITDPNGNTTTYTYDPNTDELMSTSGEAEPSVSSTTSFTYENYLPKTITRNGTTYSYEYDAQNRVTSSKIGTQTLSTISYDDNQRLSGVTYANGASYSPVYDSKDRLSEEIWNGEKIAEYYYNENDCISKVVDVAANASYQYDYAFYDLPFRVTGSDGTQTTYDYDRSGYLARLTFSYNDDIIYSGRYYNNEKGLPEDVVLSEPVNTNTHYNYDKFNRLTGKSHGPIIESVSYLDNDNDTGYLVSQYVNKNSDGNLLQQSNYTYDSNSNITSVYEPVSGKTTTYSYDGLNRIVSESDGTDTLLYNYDNGGNLTSVVKNDNVLYSFSYDNNNWKDQMTSVNGQTVTYDENGNLLQYGDRHFVWDKGNQLVGIWGGGINVVYKYDSQGRRISQRMGSNLTKYYYAGDLLVREVTGSNTTDYLYDAQGNAIGFIHNNLIYYYIHNQLGDVIGLTDESGEIVAEYSYDAYGNMISCTGIGIGVNHFLYRGYYYDYHTGLYFLDSRYYKPEWRRFISSDSLFVAGDAINGSNMYAYCNGNPIMYVDPSGLYSFSDLVGDTIWFNSKVASYVFLPVSYALTPVSNKAVETTRKIFDEEDKTSSFAETKFYSKVSPLVNTVAGTAIPALGNTTPQFSETFDIPTGLRHLMPLNMEFLTPWAEYYLGFEPKTYGRYENYTSVDGKTMWQSDVGYISMYDFFFSLGGPIFKDKYPFSTSNNDYVIWIWKGDYWNLGAGAEIGIYTATQPQNAEDQEVFYQINTNNTLHVEMTVKYKYFGLIEDTLNVFEDDNWWVCSFTPELQMPQIRWLSVDLKVRFNNETLMEPFYDRWCYLNGDKTEENDWNEVKMAPTDYKSRATDHTTHKCSSMHPTKCSCSYTCCSKPCRYYSDNGYQFYINY